MQIYANGFAVAMSDDKQELILNFVQNVPDLSNYKSAEDFAPVNTVQTEPVAQLVLNAKCGKALVDMLAHLYENESEN